MEKKRKAVKKKILSSDKMENKAKETKKQKVEKAESKQKMKFDHSKRYQFISNGSAKRLPKGSTWDITGEVAEIFISKGYGSIKE